MSVRLVNLDGRAGLLVGGRVVDVEALSGGGLPADPMAVIGRWPELAALAERAGDDVEKAYMLAVSRKPTPAERDMALTYIRSNSFKTFAQALLSSNEFLYVD